MAAVSAGDALGSSSGGNSSGGDGDGAGSPDIRSDSGSSSSGGSSGSEALRGAGSRDGVVVGSSPAQALVGEQQAGAALSAPSRLAKVENSHTDGGGVDTVRSGGQDRPVVAGGEHEQQLKQQQQQQQQPLVKEALLDDDERLKGEGQHDGGGAGAGAKVNRQGGDGGDGSKHAADATEAADGGDKARAGEVSVAQAAPDVAAESLEAMIEQLPPGFFKCPGCPMVS